jgi:poly-gamma-glutamate synthesis protein (capsule biosynthesis protein)
MRQILLWIFLFSFVFSACAPTPVTLIPVLEDTPATPTSTPLPPPSPTPLALWVSPAAPETLRSQARVQGLLTADTREAANVWLEPTVAVEGALSRWVYALVAPFPTVSDGVTLEQLKQAWAGNPPEVFAGRPLLMTESTASAMKSLFGGEPAAGALRIVPAEEIQTILWVERPAWGIVPFEALTPKLKVLEVDGQSPLRKEFDLAAYPLTVTFALDGAAFALPATNRDPEKLATVVMTGVTALVRATAAKMEEKGNLYPAQDLANWLLDADIAHISNEIPFAVGCPFPDPNQRKLIFCSDPKYIELLEYVGTDVVELTGNHFQDWGKEATFNTIAMYRERNWPYYGGGTDLADSQKPAILERGGMSFAFIGCNPVGPEFAWARADGWPGAAPCGDYDWLVEAVTRLKAEGHIVIVTFQYFEYYSSDPRPWQQKDFRRVAEAGAVVVSGSQAHYPQAMEFYGNSFIHYGLGNLFFDQMGYDNPSNGVRTIKTRYEFLDRHVFYDGRLIGTELLTAMLEDYAKPRPMTPAERAEFLEEYFIASGWQ